MSASEREFYLYPDGKRVQVSREVYEEYYHSKRTERYFMEDIGSRNLEPADQRSVAVRTLKSKYCPK